MKTTESLIRIAILITLTSAAFLLILGEEQHENIPAFFFHVIHDKAFGIGCIYTMSRLYKRWSKTDKWIARFDAWSAKGLEQ